MTLEKDVAPHEQIHHVTCPLCEATCGLTIRTSGRTVRAITGDKDDLFSQGYLCPKAATLTELDADPDRIRQPMIRRGAHWETATWTDAFAAIKEGLLPILREHGPNAIATYLGNPNVHNLAGMLYGPVLLKAIGSRNLFSASTVDQMPKQVAVGLMFGTGLSVPIPDVDRTSYLLVIGANPLVSNGSLMTAPDMRGRLQRLRERGGKLVVIDPVRTRTADAADVHHFIRPGTDALLLFALVHTLFAEGLVNPGRLAEHLTGLDQLAALARPFTPEAVAPHCTIDADTIRRLARDLATAESAAVYGRMGTSTQTFGTLASWLIDVLNILTGNLDRPGGAMFPCAAAGGRNTGGRPGKGRGVKLGRWQSRVRGLPEVYGELPVACLAEEILTPGQDQVRALITIAGNPVLSTPNSDNLQEALRGLDFMVSVDLYLNETTRHANVILPAPSPLERSHYDLVFYQLAVRNVANYSAPVFAPAPGQLDEWEVLLHLAAIIVGEKMDLGAHPVAALDTFTLSQMIQREVETPGSPIEGRDAAVVLAALAPRTGPARMLDFLLRTGPYGDGFGQRPEGLTLATLEANPHGVDLGALAPRIPEVLRTASGKIELAPDPLTADVDRLLHTLHSPPADAGALLLVGRRDMRSNNSWMHNLPALRRGKSTCTLYLHPTDGARLGLGEGALATVTSRVSSLQVPVTLTDSVMPGVVSLPHGWGHDLAGARLQVAARQPGVNMNRLSDETTLDPLSGNAVLNAIAVTLAPA